MKTKIISALMIIVLLGFCAPTMINAQGVSISKGSTLSKGFDVCIDFVSDTTGTNLPFSKPLQSIEAYFGKVIYTTDEYGIVLLVIPNKNLEDKTYQSFRLDVGKKSYICDMNDKLAIVRAEGKSVKSPTGWEIIIK